jgi:hypothetical protein
MGWCTPEDVGRKMSEQIPTELCQMYIDVASEMLYTLSGRKYPTPVDGVVATGLYVNRHGRVKLNDYQPVREVTKVEIGGVEVTFTLSPAKSHITVPYPNLGPIPAFRYESARMPRALADVTMNVGQDPPLIGRRAAAALAAQFVRGDPLYVELGGKNPLPDFRLISLHRSGTAWTYAHPVELVKAKMTGEYEVDLFLRAVNPHGAQFPSKVR